MLPVVQTLAVAACLATLFVLFARVITHNIFFDEALHVHYLWLLSVGERAYRDFFCQYPVPGYLAVLPVFKQLPESAYVVVLLRLSAVTAVAGAAALLGRHGRTVAGSWTWGTMPLLMLAATTEMSNFLVEYNTDSLALLAAAGAFVVFASEPEPPRVALAAALCVLSVSIMPKYAPMLFFGGVGFLVAAGREGGWRRPLTWGCAGAAAAAAAVWALLRSNGIPLGDMIAMVGFQSRYVLNLSYSNDRVAAVLLHALGRHWPLAALVGAGLAGWAVSARRVPMGRRLPLFGMLVGAIIYAVRFKSVFEQMLMPVLVVLVFFVPYASRLFLRAGSAGLPARRLRWLELALSATALAAACLGFAEARGDFRMTHWGRDPASPYVKWPAIKPGIETLHDIDSLLKLIPPGERVVALWFRHPLFRRDLTFVTFDEQESFTRTMPADFRARRFFDPSVFKEALEKSPPAYISLILLDRNYPPGWKRVCEEFLQSHAGLYTRFQLAEGDVAYLRNDLLSR